MKKVLFGLGAVAATILAVKKFIDAEMEKEYIQDLEKQWEEEANFEEFSNVDGPFQDSEEEVEQIFAESENLDMSENLLDKAKGTFVKVWKSIPHVRVTINIEDKKSKNEE